MLKSLILVNRIRAGKQVLNINKNGKVEILPNEVGLNIWKNNIVKSNQKQRVYW